MSSGGSRPLEGVAEANAHASEPECGPSLKNGPAIAAIKGREKAPDPNMVDWDGQQDSDCPRNWKPGTKMVQVLLVTGFTLYA